MKLYKTLSTNRCNSHKLVPTKNVIVANMINILKSTMMWSVKLQVHIESLTLNGLWNFIVIG